MIHSKLTNNSADLAIFFNFKTEIYNNPKMTLKIELPTDITNYEEFLLETSEFTINLNDFYNMTES